MLPFKTPLFNSTYLAPLFEGEGSPGGSGAGDGGSAGAGDQPGSSAPNGASGGEKSGGDSSSDDLQLKDIADLLKADERVSEADGGDDKKSQEGDEKQPPTSKDGEPDGGKGEGKDGKPSPQASEPGAQPKPDEGKKEPGLKDLLKEVIAEAKGAEDKPGDKKDGKDQQPAPPKYAGINIPPEIMQAVENQDPAIRKKGLEVLIGGAMSKVHDDVVATIRAEVQQHIAALPQLIEQQTESKTRLVEAAKKFYEDYPQFNTEKGKQLVVSYTATLASRLGKDFKGFTPEFAKTLGDELVELTGLQKPAEKKADEAPKKPAGAGFQAGTGARNAGAQAGAKTVADEITELLH